MDIQKLYNRILLTFVFVIPISQFISVRLLIILLIFSFFIKSQLGFFLFAKRAWDIIFYLMLLAGGLIYSSDMTTGLNVMETSSSLLAIPMVISRIPSFDREIRLELFRAFLLGLITASVICLMFAGYRYLEVPNLRFFFFDNFTEPIGSQPIYFAYYLIFMISASLYSLYYHIEEGNNLVRYGVVLFLFLILILTCGQTAFVSILFVFSFFILKFFSEETNREKKIVTSFIALMLFCMFFITNFEKGDRALPLNDSWERAVLWESAVSAMSSPFLGVGTGDYKIALNEYYTTHNLSQFASESYNAHNQFIQILFSNGIFGVLALSFMLARPLYLAMEKKHILAILCVFPFLIYGMTEVFLGRYQGVVFFTLLHQIFVAEMNSDMHRIKTSTSNANSIIH